MKYQRAALDDETVKKLIELSYIWEKEDITFGFRHNERSDLNDVCYIAIDKGNIVGYIFGEYYTNDKYSAFANIGDKFFFINEIFVHPDYRSKGIGKKLFSLIEKEVKDNVTCITLGTATKDYQKILNFYIKEVGMTFHSAFLFKKTK